MPPVTISWCFLRGDGRYESWGSTTQRNDKLRSVEDVGLRGEEVEERIGIGDKGSTTRYEVGRP